MIKKSSFLIFVFLTLLYFVLAILYKLGYHWIIPESGPPGFYDLRVVLESTSCFNKGFNPYFTTNTDCPHLYNYPFVWIWLTNFFHLTIHEVYFIGFGMIFIFVLSISFLFRKITISNLILLVITLISPPILLLLDRANIDILIFILLLIACYYLRSGNITHTKVHFSYILILIATMLKIYPGFLLAFILIDPIEIKQKLIVAFYSTLILFFYSLLNLHEILILLGNTPHPSELAFGKNVWIQEFVSEKRLPYVSLICLIISGFLIFYKRLFFLNLVSNLSFEKTKEGRLFFAGLLLFSGTYFFGNNWDYRLVFVMFFLPYLFLISKKNVVLNNFKNIFIFLLFIVLFTSFIHRSGYFFNSYNSWLIGRNLLMGFKYLIVTFFTAFGLLVILFYLNKQFKSLKTININ